MLKNSRCTLCDYELDEEDYAVGYCSVCGEPLKGSNEMNQMAKKKKKEERK